MKNKWITAVLVVIGLAACVGLGLYVPTSTRTQAVNITDLSVDDGTTASILEQERTKYDTEPHIIHKMYVKDQLLGVINDTSVLTETMKHVYQQSYEQDFPDTSLGLGEDLYIVDEQSYFEYENIDDTIMAYLVSNDLFSVVTNKIEFSNGAVIYVKNVDDFTQAREEYLLNFISKGVYDLLKSNQKPEQLSTFGEQEISMNVAETMAVTSGLASATDIMTTKEEILEFLCYGYGVTKEYYTVQKYDTVDGVSSKAKTGLSTEQLITINPGVLVSKDQILEEGMKLNITYFDSPLTVTVVKERLVEETIYPKATKYIYDDSLEYGQRIKVTKEVIGKRNVRYYDTYVNGVLVSGDEISSITTVQAVQEVVRVGTGGVDDFYYEGGTGEFQWPVKHHTICCGWLCYSGHYAIDIQNRYNKYDNIYASDSGKVINNSYDSIGGYHVMIYHGDNTYTYYGHMKVKSSVKVGEFVEKGQWIGKIGMTGYATAPHVHFEVWIGYPYRSGKRINPCKVLGC